MEAAEVGRTARITVALLVAATVALLVIAAAILYTASMLDGDGPYDPLRYPTQTVTSRVPGVSGPAVRLGETVHVTAEKCSDDAVSIVGVTSWRPVDPASPGVTVEGETAGLRREAGCEVARFQNPIPPEIQARVAAQHAAGIMRPLWVIVGTETPTNVDTGEEGSTEVWETEPFVIAPAEPVEPEAG